MSATSVTASARQQFLDGKNIVPFAPVPSVPAPARSVPRQTLSDTQSLPRERAYSISSVLVLGDLVVASLAIFAGLEFREWQRVGSFFGPERADLRPWLAAWSVGGGAVFVWLMAMFKTYEVANLYRIRRWTNNLVRSLGLWAVVCWACIGLFQITAFTPRLGVVYCLLTLGTGITLWRLCSFVFLVQPQIKESASKRCIVVGWNDKASHLRTSMRRDLAQLEQIIGCVPLPGGLFTSKPPADVAVLGDYSSLPALISECQANSVILADVSCPSREIQHLISFCQREMLGFQLIPEYFPALNSGLQVQTVSGVPLLGVSQLPLDRTLNRAVKRAIDIVGSMVGLLVFAPVIAAFGLIVYIESPGSVIYRQRRTSRGGRNFWIYKIRSMRLDAESASGAVWCKREDDRRLKIGTFMRKTNIDELPQFWNVLKGDMSLVGPRPERPELIEKFKDQIPNYNARHEVRTGVTGWAQIRGLRGDTDLGKRIEADLYYMENWSVLLDLYCIVATFRKSKNAH